MPTPPPDKRHPRGTRTPFVLWELHSPSGAATECSLRELESSDRFQVTVTEDGHMYMWMTFDSPMLALEWAVIEEDRLIGEGWRTTEMAPGLI
jgi:hypothetical protein